MVEILCKNEILEIHFNDLLSNDIQFKNRTKLFYEKFPIVSIKNLRKFEKFIKDIKSKIEKEQTQSLNQTEKEVLKELKISEPYKELLDYKNNHLKYFNLIRIRDKF